MKRSLFVFSMILIFSMLAVSLLSSPGGQVQAQGDEPPRPTRERVQLNKVDLSEVEAHYGRLADRKGKIGVVVEFEAEPAALVYARSQGRLQSEMTSLTQNQIAQIEEEQAAFQRALRQKGIQAQELFRTQKVFNGIWLRLEAKDVPKLRTLPGVKAIHPIIPKTIEHTTSVPLIGAPQVWGGLTNYQGENIKIGIIDTGIDYLHTNFGGPGTGYDTQVFTSTTETGNLFPTAKVVGGYDFVGDDYDATTNPIPQPDPDPMDCNGHGSHVAGTAAGFGVLTNGSTYQESGADTYANLKNLTQAQYIAKFRIAPGVAPKAKLYALRVFGCSGSTDVTEQALEWAMDPNGDGNLSDHLDVINMSLGSSFGSEYDTTAIAANNAALAGVIVVAAAGNSGDVFYIHGSPAVARYAISVAASLDQGAVVSAFEVTDTLSPLYGQHPAVEASFGPQTFDVTAPLTTTVPADGCNAITSNVSGKIALIDRGGCTFVTKVKNAQDAGAVGVLVANNVAGFPFAMAGTDATITIPSMMTTLAVGNALKSNFPLNVKLTSAYRNQFTTVDNSLRDTIPSFTSRGPGRFGTSLKPDLTAPGETIYSTDALSGNKGVSYNGTSMAAPHVAGAMALLRQKYPTWSVADLKALVMNTASNDLYVGLNQSGNPHTPTRVGAGRLNVEKAAQSPVIAYASDDPGVVSLSFGEVPVVETGSTVDQTFTKSITLKNTTGTAVSYNVSFVSRYQANPGLTFTLLDASNNPLSNPVAIPANGTQTIKVQVNIDSTALTRARDPNITTDTRQRFSEGGGFVELVSTGSDPTLRVPVHIAPRPASNMAVSQTAVILPNTGSGSLAFTPLGVPVDTTDDNSLVAILEWLGNSPDDSWSSGPNDAADLRYIGAATDFPYYNFTQSAVYFGVATYGKWDTPSSVEFDIYIDNNEDGVDDFVVFNVNQGFFTGSANDVQLAAYCPIIDGTTIDLDNCDADFYLNALPGGTNTNLFHNNVMFLPVAPASIGLQEGINTDFSFYIITWSRDDIGWTDLSGTMFFDIAHPGFYSVDPNITELPVWVDDANYSASFAVSFNKAAIGANGTKGLLFLHHHNTSNTAQALALTPYVAYYPLNFKETLWGTPLLPITLTMVLENRTSSACNFQLSVAGNTWPVILNGSATRFVLGGQSTQVNYTVKVPTSAVLGDTDTFTVTAQCASNPSYSDTYQVIVKAGQMQFLPLISR